MLPPNGCHGFTRCLDCVTHYCSHTLVNTVSTMALFFGPTGLVKPSPVRKPTFRSLCLPSQAPRADGDSPAPGQADCTTIHSRHQPTQTLSVDRSPCLQCFSDQNSLFPLFAKTVATSLLSGLQLPHLSPHCPSDHVCDVTGSISCQFSTSKPIYFRICSQSSHCSENYRA